MDFDLCRGAREDVFPFASSMPHCRKIAIGNSSRVVNVLVTELPDPVVFPRVDVGHKNYLQQSTDTSNKSAQYLSKQ